jgi:hypothetical protein
MRHLVLQAGFNIQFKNTVGQCMAGSVSGLQKFRWEEHMGLRMPPDTELSARWSEHAAELSELVAGWRCLPPSPHSSSCCTAFTTSVARIGRSRREMLERGALRACDFVGAFILALLALGSRKWSMGR